MRKHTAALGGELSCHFFFHDRYFGYDDGIYAMMRLFELVLQSGKNLTQLLKIFPKKYNSPEFRIACDEKDKKIIIAAVEKAFKQRPEVTMITIDGIRASMPYGWGLIRASNTQSELCLRFESDTSQGLQRVKQDVVQLLQPYFDATELKKIVEGKA